MKTALKSMWKSLTNAVETSTDNKELSLHRPINGTPFQLSGNEEHGYFITLGQYRLTQAKPTPENALEQLEAEPWEIISRMVAAYIDFEKRTKTIQEEATQTN